MKKRFAVVAVALALGGAAAVPAGSAFAKAKKPPSATAVAVHCALLESVDNSYDASIAAASGVEKAILEALEESNETRASALGCAWVLTD